MEAINQSDLDLARKEMKQITRGPMDRPFLMMVILLACVGLIMMFSASYAVGASNEKLGATYFVRSQGFYLLIGIGAMLLTSRFNYHQFRRFALPLMGVAVACLFLVRFTPLGKTFNGARRWISIFGMSFQPSEVAKVAVILMFANLIDTFPHLLTQRRAFPWDEVNRAHNKGFALMRVGMRQLFTWGGMPYLGILAAVVGLLMLEPHISGSIIIFTVGAAMMFLGGLSWKIIAPVGLGGGGLAAVAVLFLPYAQRRIQAWQDPWSDLLGKGWQVVQSLYAIGSGGLLGVGLGHSRQKQLYLPEPQNDYVFAIVVEELGFIGAGIILLVYMVLVCRGFWIALHARDRFGMLLAGGVSTLLALQTLLNVAVVTNAIPCTGIPMPFFSYGGTSLIILLVQMGIVLSVSREIKPGIDGN